MVLTTLLALSGNKVWADANKLIDTTVKLTVTNSEGMVCKGSATVIDEDADKFFLLTSGHIVEDESCILINLYHMGAESLPIPGKLEKYKFHNVKGLGQNGGFTAEQMADPPIDDLAIVSFEKKLIIDYVLPKVAKIAPDDYKIKEKQVIFTMGCAAGNWPSLIKGQVQTVCEKFFVYWPTPLQGRSGSGIFTEDDLLIGVVAYSNGTCVHSKLINSFIKDWKLSNG